MIGIQILKNSYFEYPTFSIEVHQKLLIAFFHGREQKCYQLGRNLSLR
jgi:hypothetical protein